MLKFIAILYLISGIMLHRSLSKTDRVKAFMKECSHLETFLFTLYSVLFVPALTAKCFIKCFIDCIKGGNK